MAAKNRNAIFKAQLKYLKVWRASFEFSRPVVHCSKPSRVGCWQCLSLLIWRREEYQNIRRAEYQHQTERSKNLYCQSLRLVQGGKVARLEKNSWGIVRATCTSTRTTVQKRPKAANHGLPFFTLFCKLHSCQQSWRCTWTKWIAKKICLCLGFFSLDNWLLVL